MTDAGVAELAERLYECARVAGTIRHDSVLWWLLEPRRRERWLTYARLFAPADGETLQLPNTRAEADALYQAALDQPQPTAQLREAIRQYDSASDHAARARMRKVTA